MDGFVENVVINIVALLELFSAGCPWQKAEEFGLAKGLVGPQNKHRNKYRGLYRAIYRKESNRHCVDNIARCWEPKLCDI